jgi:hypothetical protein
MFFLWSDAASTRDAPPTNSGTTWRVARHGGCAARDWAGQGREFRVDLAMASIDVAKGAEVLTWRTSGREADCLDAQREAVQDAERHHPLMPGPGRVSPN